MRALLIIAVMWGAAVEQVPANLPPSNRVTDKSRPDFGYSPWLGSEITVAVAFGVDCKPCADSIGFYKRIATLLDVDRKSRRLVFLTEGGIFPVLDLIA